jgi:DNA-binding beta-propeller fold protein YncE
MRRMANTRPGRFAGSGMAAVIVLALVATACGRAGSSSTAQGQRTATANAASPSAPSAMASGAWTPPAVPNPLTVVATYSAASLGLKRIHCHGPRLGGCTEELAVGPDGDVYVTDSVTSTVTEVSPAGKVRRTWGGPGKGPGQFHFVTRDPLDPTDIDASIAVGPDGDVYVTDSGNGRVEVFSSQGTFIRQVGSLGIQDGQFLLPYDLAVDQQSDLFAVDQDSSTITKFSPAGKFLWQIGGAMSPDPELSQTEFHLAGVDAHGRLVAAATDAHAVVSIDGSGHKVDSFPVTGFPPGLGPCSTSVDAAGDTFALSCGYTGESGGQTAAPDRSELVFDRTHRLVGAWYQSPFQVSPRFGPNGEAFAVADDGSLLKLKVALPGA